MVASIPLDKVVTTKTVIADETLGPIYKELLDSGKCYTSAQSLSGYQKQDMHRFNISEVASPLSFKVACMCWIMIFSCLNTELLKSTRQVRHLIDKLFAHLLSCIATH